MGGDPMTTRELHYWLLGMTPEAIAWRTNAPLAEWAGLLVAYRRGLPVARPAALASKGNGKADTRHETDQRRESEEVTAA